MEIVKGLFPKTVARKQESGLLAVPERNGEHPTESRQRISALTRQELQRDLVEIVAELHALQDVPLQTRLPLRRWSRRIAKEELFTASEIVTTRLCMRACVW